MKIDNGFVDPRPMQDVLRPAIDASGDDAKKIFHGERLRRPNGVFSF